MPNLALITFFKKVKIFLDINGIMVILRLSKRDRIVKLNILERAKVSIMRKNIVIAAAVIMLACGAVAQDYEWSEPVSVDVINTPANENYSYLSENGQLLLWNAEGTICMSRWNGENWEPRELLPEPVNSAGLERAVAITPDHTYIYWVSWREGGMGGWDIWRCSWDEDNNIFGNAECLGENINSEAYEFGVCFTPDGSRMFFVSDVYHKNGQYGYGAFDLWYCDWDSTLGDWGLPYNVGGYINSTGDELTPFVSRVGIMVNYTLFFASNYHHGLPGYQGDDDIFSVRWEGEGWSNLMNLGTPINSEFRDNAPGLTQDGQTMYFCNPRDREQSADRDVVVSHLEPNSIEEDKLPDDGNDIEIRIEPNPFNQESKFTIISTSSKKRAIALIYDIQGKEVKDLGIQTLNGQHVIIWDGKNNAGEGVSSGIYFFSLISPDSKPFSKKFTFMK